jgi:Uncharacterized conserved protein
MTQPSRIHLFQGFGIELEYMIVDKETLAVKSITDELIKHQLGEYGSDFENGIVTWSNELVLHVIELKSTRPELNFTGLEHGFAENVKLINAILDKHHAMLMPSAAHPLMNPMKETKLWPHDNNEVYEIYNRIFDCRGHGWSNLQSTHLNLPFYDDEQFAKLHAAVRIILPMLPALCASSPILDGTLSGFLDTRLNFYKTNQARIPSITGKVVPEAIFSKRNYLNTIYEKIKADIAPFDPEQILNPIWVNSRGAIPRFDRGSIEIRIMDIQECPTADMAIITLVIETIKALCNEKFVSLEEQMKWKTETLVQLLDKTIATGPKAVFDNADYLKIFDIQSTQATAKQIWESILAKLVSKGPLEKWTPELLVILKEGTLSQRIIKSLDGNTSPESIKKVYRQLCGCLDQNKMFLP